MNEIKLAMMVGAAISCLGMTGCSGKESESAASTDKLGVQTPPEKTQPVGDRGSPEAAGQAVPPRQVARVMPGPGTPPPLDADTGGEVGWPTTIEWASYAGQYAVSGTVTSVGEEVQFVFAPKSPGRYGVGLGQEVVFEPDDAVALTWVEESWGAELTDVGPSEIESFPWLMGPIGYVDDNGEVLPSEEGEYVVGGQDLLPPPDALKAGQRVLVFLGLGSFALPGAPAFTTAPVMTAIFVIDGENVILGDGSSVSLSAATSTVETVYAKQRSDYAETPANMASGPDASP